MGKKASIGGTLSVGGGSMIMIGMLIGLVSDAMWYTLGLPGSKTPVSGCSIITDADAIQIMVTGAMTMAGFLMNIKTFPALTFGIMAGMLIPKIVTPYFHLPRYGVFDYNPATGSISKAV